MWTVALQYKRLSRREPEDEDFVMRWWADLEFFLVALGRLERSAAIALSVPEVRPQVAAALTIFRKALPAASISMRMPLTLPLVTTER